MSDEDLRQQRGFFFEVLKHLTTLATAAALVTLGVHRETDLPLLPVLLFVFSLLFSSVGMVLVALAGTGVEASSRATNFLILGAATFGTGLLLIVLYIA